MAWLGAHSLLAYKVIFLPRSHLSFDHGTSLPFAQPFDYHSYEDHRHVSRLATAMAGLITLAPPAAAAEAVEMSSIALASAELYHRRSNIDPAKSLLRRLITGP